jgi:hypothetical protein
MSRRNVPVCAETRGVRQRVAVAPLQRLCNLRMPLRAEKVRVLSRTVLRSKSQLWVQGVVRSDAQKEAVPWLTIVSTTGWGACTR